MLNPGVIQNSLLSARAAAPQPFNGVSYDRLALGLALGLTQWAVGQPQNLALSGIATGLVGSGVIAAPTSKLTVPPNAGVMQAALMGAGIAGTLSSSLALVLSLGISQAFSTYGQYTSLCGVGTGADVSRVTTVSAAALIGILNGTLRSVVGSGPSIGMLASGIGNGVAKLLLLGTGTGVVSGAPGPPR